MMFQPTSNPRSILKHQHQSLSYSSHPEPINTTTTTTNCHRSCAVRFPSSPKISTVHFTHCSSSYDRRPIVVLPNSCELPDRGCRDYGVASPQMGGQTALPQSWGKHVHPSVFERRMSETAASSSNACSASQEVYDHEELYNGGAYGWFSGPPPALTHDDASSEESDGIASPPPEQHHQSNTRAAHYLSPSQSHLHSEPLSHPPIPDSYGASLSSFLPHAPSVKREKKKRSSLEGTTSKRACMSTPASFGWTATTEEDSCLGGF